AAARVSQPAPAALRWRPARAPRALPPRPRGRARPLPPPRALPAAEAAWATERGEDPADSSHSFRCSNAEQGACRWGLLRFHREGREDREGFLARDFASFARFAVIRFSPLLAGGAGAAFALVAEEEIAQGL